MLLLLCLAPGHPCNAAPKPRGGGTTPPGRGNGRLLPVLDNGNPREPSADRAESTDSPDGPDSTGWDWDVIRWGNNPPQRDPYQYDTCEVLYGSAHPAGVNAVVPGDTLQGGVDGVDTLSIRIVQGRG